MKRLIINMPIGINFGWGICGRYLTRELARLCDVELITEEIKSQDVRNEKEMSALNDLVKYNGPYRNSFDSPILQAIQGINLKPWYMEAESDCRIGYTFFEKDFISPGPIQWAKEYFDIIIAGSSYCEAILNKSGYSNTKTIIQGIDETVFHPQGDKDEKYGDYFIIFSGGKLELRKGQDLVIRAFKAMQDKYKDVLLLNLWFNQWTASMDSMMISPYIRFEMPKGDYFKAINHLLGINAIDLRRVITLPPTPNEQMADIYRNTDIGLFPNRCEGGTNLVLMEYMACGKPVISSCSTGHRDILTKYNSLAIESLRPFRVNDKDGNNIYNWEEPDLDEIISSLEWAYWHRDELKDMGKRAGEDLSRLTWRDSARQFYEYIF